MSDPSSFIGGTPGGLRGLSDLIEHLRAHSLKTDGPYRLRSGEISDWYLDARQSTFDGQGSLLVGDAMLSVLADGVQAVGGMTMGADPIAVATAGRAAATGRTMKAFSIRKETKGHGTGGRVVGPVRAGDRVTVVEDTTTTGGALTEAIEVAGGHGLKVVQAVALVDRSGGRVTGLLADLGIPYRCLLTPADLGLA